MAENLDQNDPDVEREDSEDAAYLLNPQAVARIMLAVDNDDQQQQCQLHGNQQCRWQ